MPTPSFFEKQPGEKYTIAIEYLGNLPASATVSSGTVSAKNLSTGATDNTVLASTTATISGTQARVDVQAGTNQIEYKITFLTTLSNSNILEDDLMMRVIDY